MEVTESGQIGKSESNSQHQEQEHQHPIKESTEPDQIGRFYSHSELKEVSNRTVKELWGRLIANYNVVHSYSQSHPSLGPIFDKNALENWTLMIYTSNAQEQVGLDFTSTEKICHQMMPYGPDVDPENVDVGTEDYSRALDFLKREGRLIKQLTEKRMPQTLYRQTLRLQLTALDLKY